VSKGIKWKIVAVSEQARTFVGDVAFFVLGVAAFLHEGFDFLIFQALTYLRLINN